VTNIPINPTQWLIALIQFSPTMGDLTGNIARIASYYRQATAKQAKLVIFPELALTGYPPDDLLWRPAFINLCQEALQHLKQLTLNQRSTLVVGSPYVEHNTLYNALIVFEDGQLVHVIKKHQLAHNGIFDEPRHFMPGPPPKPISLHGKSIGFLICEDFWHQSTVAHLANEQPDCLFVSNASPFETNKLQQRHRLASLWSQSFDMPIAYVNLVGGQDEIVFDGGSFLYNGNHPTNPQCVHEFPLWEEGVFYTKLHFPDNQRPYFESDPNLNISSSSSNISPRDETRSSLYYHAMTLALKHYVKRNHFPGVLIGMSGGIDSALTAAVAVDALGKEAVRLVMLPSMHTSEQSLDDAASCADLLGVSLEQLPITPIYELSMQGLNQIWGSKEFDLTEENLQSRIRGMLLMALSNQSGFMLLTTGNKSELATGYATLYGDMCGGFNILKDCYKIEVFALARWRNHHRPALALGPSGKVIPNNILFKEPSAELRPNQKDTDSLPRYEILDDILVKIIEERCSSESLYQSGYDRKMVEKVTRLLYRAEYKRHQAAPGVKLTSCSFGRERRYPLTHFFRD
jgi:NAD+ synthase